MIYLWIFAQSMPKAKYNSSKSIQHQRLRRLCKDMLLAIFLVLSVSHTGWIQAHPDPLSAERLKGLCITCFLVQRVQTGYGLAAG